MSKAFTLNQNCEVAKSKKMNIIAANKKYNDIFICLNYRNGFDQINRIHEDKWLPDSSVKHAEALVRGFCGGFAANSRNKC